MMVLSSCTRYFSQLIVNSGRIRLLYIAYGQNGIHGNESVSQDYLLCDPIISKTHREMLDFFFFNLFFKCRIIGNIPWFYSFITEDSEFF